MAEGKESFVFYKSFYDAIKQIPEEYQLELYNAILGYSLEGEEPNNLSNIASAMFTLIKPNIDSSKRKYEANINNGKMGGRPKKDKTDDNPNETQEKSNQNPNKTQEKPNQNLNEDDDVNEDDNVNVNEDVNVNVADVIVAYENNIASVTQISSELLMSYCEDLSPALVKEAITKAVLVNKRNMKYIQGILNDWVNKGFKTMIDIKNEEEEYKKSKTNKKQQETEEEKTARRLKELKEATQSETG